MLNKMVVGQTSVVAAPKSIVVDHLDHDNRKGVKLQLSKINILKGTPKVGTKILYTLKSGDNKLYNAKVIRGT